MKPYPCKDCEKRRLSCHDYCPEFLAVKKENERAKVEHEKYINTCTYFARRRRRKNNLSMKGFKHD